MESENEEDSVVSYKNKYRQLKSRLKYLIYEHECFENDIQKAQTKLLQLSRDKSFLLDQLMRYEAVVLSGGEEETDYSSGEETLLHSTTAHHDTAQKIESGSKSEESEQPAQPAPPPSSVRPSQLTKQGIAKATALLNSIATSAASKTSGTVKTGGVRKPSKASTKVSAVAAAKITKAVARARQNPPPLSSGSPLIVSLPLNVTSLGGRSKPPQTTPTRPPLMTSVTSTSSTAAILASIPVPPKPPAKTLAMGSTQTASKAATVALGGGGGGRLGREVGSPASSSSSSSSSSDSEDSGSESSSSSSSRDGEPMETGGPVPIVRSVPIPAGGPQLVRPKAISSPVKAPPQLIPALDPTSSSSSPSHAPLLSPLTSPGTHSQATRFLWSNRPSGDGQTLASSGFTSIGPPLSSPTSLSKPSSGSAFQLVTSPPGSAPLHRPPSLQDVSGLETARPHPPP